VRGFTQLFVTGKLWNAHHGKAHVEKACRKTLRDLRLKQLDLYLIHWPVAGANRGAVVTPPLRETWQAMEALVDAGLVKAIGLSNFSVKKAQAVLEYARVRPSVIQVPPSHAQLELGAVAHTAMHDVHCAAVCMLGLGRMQAEAHPYFRNDALVEWCASEGIHFTAYAPLGSPDSASMLSRRSAGPELMMHPTVVEVARRTGRDVGQVLLRWALQRRPGCSVLPKSVTPSRITSNLTGVRGLDLPITSLPVHCVLSRPCSHLT
jgi:diketogulonate reductase-like aldo/keto reductase